MTHELNVFKRELLLINSILNNKGGCQKTRLTEMYFSVIKRGNIYSIGYRFRQEQSLLEI